MRWARHYKRKDSAAERVLKRMDRRGRLKDSKPAKAQPKAAGVKAARAAGEASIPQEKRFFLPDGRSLGSVAELAMALDSVPDCHFRSHVNDSKNDFANWIRDVFEQRDLADEIAGIKDKKDCQIALLKHLAAKR